MKCYSSKTLCIFTTLLIVLTTGCSGIQPLVDKGKEVMALIGEENTKIKIKKQKLKNLEDSLKTEESKGWWSRDNDKIARYIQDIRKYALDIIADVQQK